MIESTKRKHDPVFSEKEEKRRKELERKMRMISN